jgi:hypothetical protein
VLKVAVPAQAGHLTGEGCHVGDAGVHRRRRQCGRGTPGAVRLVELADRLGLSGEPDRLAGRGQPARLGTGRAGC